MQVHDSKKEVLDMGEDFLTRFTQQLPVDTVLHNFSPTCDRGDGRAGEAFDVENLRRHYVKTLRAWSVNYKARSARIHSGNKNVFSQKGKTWNHISILIRRVTRFAFTEEL